MYAEIHISCPVEGPFTYRIPDQLEVVPGMRVHVDFAGRKSIGFVTACSDTYSGDYEIKDILDVVDPEPIFSDSLTSLCSYVSQTYLSSIGEALSMALPSAIKPSARYKNPYSDSKIDDDHNLTPEQDTIYNTISEAHTAGQFFHLIFGITGSGKTHIYIQLAKDFLAENKSVIYLLPEISLTSHIFSRLSAVFGEELVIFHSQLTAQQRLHHWQRFYKGEVKIAVGTRSAVYLQCPSLGMIIIDEEHDSSYKENSTPRYSAKNIAYYRCKQEKALLVMGSATPSIESLFVSEQGQVQLHNLTSRYGAALQSKIEIIQVKPQRSRGLISSTLKLAVKQTIEKKEQVILLLNRRGFAPMMICDNCSSVVECPHCNISLNYHKKNILLCHYCDYKTSVPTHCPSCGMEKLVLLGSGTQRIEEDIANEFSDYNVFRLDQDTARKKGTMTKLISEMNDGTIDILLGTQMVAKGFDFHNVTLVGVLMADIGINLPDFRASERIFSLLTQVAGRSGRGEKQGKVILQTLDSEQMLFKFIQSYDYYGFYKQELGIRYALKYPPYCRLARLLARGHNEEQVKSVIESLQFELRKSCQKLEHGTEIDILGPSEAPLGKIGNNFRYHIILKSSSAEQLREVIKESIKNVKKQSVYIEIDIDPYDLI